MFSVHFQEKFPVAQQQTSPYATTEPIPYITPSMHAVNNALAETLLGPPKTTITPDILLSILHTAELYTHLLSTNIYTYDSLTAKRGTTIPATRTWVSRMKTTHPLFTIQHKKQTILPTP